MPSVRWANIPQLFTLDRRCPAAWAAVAANNTDPRPSANEAGHIPSWHISCERYAPSSVVAGCRWPLLLLSLLLSVVGRGTTLPLSSAGRIRYAEPSAYRD
jgi:hypothetical protein